MAERTGLNNTTAGPAEKYNDPFLADLKPFIQEESCDESKKKQPRSHGWQPGYQSQIYNHKSSPAKKAFTLPERRYVLLVVLELGAVLEWSFTDLVVHLRSSNWDTALGSGVSLKSAEKFGWTAEDTLLKKFSEYNKKVSGQDKLSRPGCSLKNTWQSMCGKTKLKETAVLMHELITGEDFVKKVSKALEIDTEELSVIRLAAGKKFEEIKAAFMERTSRVSTPTKVAK